MPSAAAQKIAPLMILLFAPIRRSPKRKECASFTPPQPLYFRETKISTKRLIQAGVQRRERPRSSRARGQMLFPQIALYAPAPCAHKRKIQDSADRRAGHWNHPPNPFLGGFLAELHRQPLRNTRRQLLKHLLFSQVFSVIHASGRRSSQPQFHALVLAARLKSIQQTKPLNQSQGNRREYARVWQQRDHPSKPKSRTLGQRQPLRIVDEFLRDRIQSLQRHILHAAEIRDPQTMLIRKLPPEILGIHLNRAQPAPHTKPQHAVQSAPHRRSPPHFGQIRHYSSILSRWSRPSNPALYLRRATCT